MKYLRLTLLIFLVSFSTSSFANYCGKWFDNLNSPVCTDARWIFWTGAVLTTIVYFDEHNYSYRARDASLRKRPLDRWSKVGEVIGWGYANGLYFLVH